MYSVQGKSTLTYSVRGFEDFVTGFQKVAPKVGFHTKKGLFLAIFKCRGIVFLLRTIYIFGA